MTTINDDPSATETELFAERIMGAIDAASVAILLSIGHQTSLFDTLADLPPATSTQIADAARLDERYVREWLGGMAAAQIVVYDPATQAFSLPRERAAVLTRAAGPANLARVAQFLPMLGEVEQRVIGCFRAGGGLSYADYPRFHELMAAVSNEVFDAALVDVVLPLARLSDLLRDGVDVADIGCGSGHAINVMAKAFPASTFTGIDFSDQAIATGAAEANRLGVANASFLARDVAELDIVDAYDVITAFDAIHDQANPARVLDNIHRALRPGGTFLMVDIKGSSRLEDNVGMPMAPYKYAVSTMHCMSVSLGLDGAGLGTVWGRQLATAMLADAGFGDVSVREIDTDAMNYYYVAKKTI